jgi:hypothetical protein
MLNIYLSNICYLTIIFLKTNLISNYLMDVSVLINKIFKRLLSAYYLNQ